MDGKYKSWIEMNTSHEIVVPRLVNTDPICWNYDRDVTLLNPRTRGVTGVTHAFLVMCLSIHGH